MSHVPRARDLSPDARQVIESLIGRRVGDDELVVVHASPEVVIKPAPTGEEYDQAAAKFLHSLDRFHESVPSVDEDELDRAIEEAIQAIRNNRPA